MRPSVLNPKKTSLLDLGLKKDIQRNDSKSTFLVIALVGMLAVVLNIYDIINIGNVINSFPWAILMIVVAMKLFTNLIVQTGIMEITTVRLAGWSQGKHNWVLCLFMGLLFLVSGIVNNLTAILVILPVSFVLLSAMAIDRVFIVQFFSLLLAISNLAGASTPIGDFPAVIILKSGMTSFSGYFIRAFPLFFASAIVLMGVHLWIHRRQGFSQETAKQSLERRFGIDVLGVQYRHVQVKSRNLKIIGIVLMAMFVCWSMFPQFPPEMVAFGGLSAAVLLTNSKANLLGDQSFDLKPIFIISAFLFGAGMIGDSGALETIATWLQHYFTDPLALLVAVMLMTALLSGICSAGPATAAMMPLIQFLAQTTFYNHQDWLAVAFAVSICAGSSLFLWSATGGFVLAHEVKKSKLTDQEGNILHWGVRSYFKYGALHFILQLGIGIPWVLYGILW